MDRSSEIKGLDVLELHAPKTAVSRDSSRPSRRRGSLSRAKSIKSTENLSFFKRRCHRDMRPGSQSSRQGNSSCGNRCRKTKLRHIVGAISKPCMFRSQEPPYFL